MTCCVCLNETRAKKRIEPHGVMCSSCQDGFFTFKSKRRRKTRFRRNK